MQIQSSLKNNLTPEAKVNEFILLWKSPSYSNKILVLVEGRSDRLFYYKFFKEEIVELRDCGGCKKIIEIYNLLQEKTTIINLMIKDSDFERLNGNRTLGENIFFTDCHDYEMMCVKNEDTIKDVFKNLALKYKKEFISNVFSDLKLLSYFKWYNYTNHINYNFKQYSVAEKTTVELNNFDDIHKSILASSPNRTTTISKKDLLDFINDNNKCDPYELVNGHDFLNRFCYYIRIQFSEHRNLNENELKKILHPCFRVECFMQTNLYNNIKEWENKNGKVVLQMS